MVWVAFADESMRQRHDGSGIYAIAAPVIDLAFVEELRSCAADLARGKQIFHWRDADDRDRRRAVEVVAELGALNFVVVGIGLQNRRQERHRRQVLRRVLWELDQMDVSHVVLDSRRHQQDATDQAAVAGWRAQRVISSRLRIDHLRPRDEPLLCLADLVAGAVTAARGDGDLQYVNRLSACLEEITIELE